MAFQENVIILGFDNVSTTQFVHTIAGEFTQEYNPCHLKLVKSVEYVDFYALTTADAGKETWL